MCVIILLTYVIKGATSLILLTLIALGSNIIVASTINVKIYSPFPVTLVFSDSNGVKIVNSNITLNFNSSSILVNAYVLAPYSYSIFINGNETNKVNLSLENVTYLDLNVTVIPQYAYLRVNVIGRGTVYMELYNGTIISVTNSSLIKLYNGSSILLEADGNLLNWSNGASNAMLWYNVNGNSTITAFFGSSGVVQSNGNIKPTINYTEIGLSLFAIGFFLLYKIYSKRDQDTNS